MTDNPEPDGVAEFMGWIDDLGQRTGADEVTLEKVDGGIEIRLLFKEENGD